MKSYTKQIGRSMVEMLGVLAIIGVLSAGGIMGYSTAKAISGKNYLYIFLMIFQIAHTI